MKNLRLYGYKEIDTEPLGFRVVGKNDDYDFTVRVLGAAKGPLAILPDVRTTTISIKALPGKLDDVRKLFESIVLDDDDFFYSVSVPYVDWRDLMAKCLKVHNEMKEVN